MYAMSSHLLGDLAVLVKGVDIPLRILILFIFEAYMLFNQYTYILSKLGFLYYKLRKRSMYDIIIPYNNIIINIYIYDYNYIKKVIKECYVLFLWSFITLVSKFTLVFIKKKRILDD